MIRSASILVLLLAPNAASAGPCLLSNPSFEMNDGVSVGGWNAFGTVGVSDVASHGSAAVELTGPGGGGWAMSAVWQPLDTEPGDRWSASVTVTSSGLGPLSGQSTAIVNIEWRDAGGSLISFESHVAADPSTHPDSPVRFEVESGPAPADAVTTHFLLAVLQGPGDPTPTITYDAVAFENLGPPSVDDVQWDDFPGGRSLEFAGRTWRVKGPGIYGPGPNYFCDTPACTWVDGNGELHLTVSSLGPTWSSTEVVLEDALGYGDYVLTTRGRLDAFELNTVLGLFLWQYRTCGDPSEAWWNPYNEIDIEYSRWGDPANDVGQFVAQPWDYPGNIERYDAVFADDELTSHAIRWLPDRIEFRSWRGDADAEATGEPIHSWTYDGPHLARLEQPRLHLNLWTFGEPPSVYQEVRFADFRFTPDGGAVDVGSVPAALPIAGFALPNPFRSKTAITFTLDEPATARLEVFDVAGRRVRTLLHRSAYSGELAVEWDGRDAAGRDLSPGVYFVRIHAGGRVGHVRTHLLR